MNDENIICETKSYKVSPDGSEFYHCTPDILGTFSKQILSIDLAQMRYEGVELNYYWEPYNGKAVPRLSFRFSGRYYNCSSLIHLLIICDLGLQSGDGDICRELQLPDLNLLTSFYGIDVSIKLDYSSNYFDDGIISGYSQDAELMLMMDCDFDEPKSFTVRCFSFRFKIEE